MDTVAPLALPNFHKIYHNSAPETATNSSNGDVGYFKTERCDFDYNNNNNTQHNTNFTGRGSRSSDSFERNCTISHPAAEYFGDNDGIGYANHASSVAFPSNSDKSRDDAGSSNGNKSHYWHAPFRQHVPPPRCYSNPPSVYEVHSNESSSCNYDLKDVSSKSGSTESLQSIPPLEEPTATQQRPESSSSVKVTVGIDEDLQMILEMDPSIVDYGSTPTITEPKLKGLPPLPP